MSTQLPLPGMVYPHPPTPPEFGRDPLVSPLTLDPSILSTCYVVISGPDRNIHWVYKHMAQTATAIPAPIEQGCCFETVESIARSQEKSRPRQRCNTCGFMIYKHMTRIQALEAFTTHALAYPVTHLNLGISAAEGTAIPEGYGEQHGLQAPIPAPEQQPHSTPSVMEPHAVVAPVQPMAAPVQVVKPQAITPSVTTPELITLADQPSSSIHTPTTHTGMRNSGSAAPTSDQYKILTDMVKINPQLMWSDEQEAHRFLMDLESLLEFSPVKPIYWTSLILMMVPGKFELERAWIYNNIMTPLLSWPTAKLAFVKHFQRGDYLDGRRLLYAQCNQTSGETIQEYSRRFQTLATQLHYSDLDTQTIYHYVEGLHRHIQQKLITYKITMRTVGGNPTWDFISLSSTISLAITIGTEAIYTQRPQAQPTLPLHLQRSALANPTSKHPLTNNNKTKPTDIHAALTLTSKASMNPRKRITNSSTEEKKCQYHPNSTSHTTDECRTKGGGSKELNTPTPKPTLPTKPQPSTMTTTTGIKLTPTPSSNIQCYRCNQFGHMARECPQNLSNKSKLSTPASMLKASNPNNPNLSRAGQPTGQPAAPPTKRARRAHVTFNLNPTESTTGHVPTEPTSSMTGTLLKTE